MVTADESGRIGVEKQVGRLGCHHCRSLVPLLRFVLCDWDRLNDLTV